MTSRSHMALLAACFLVASSVRGAPIYIVQGTASGPQLRQGTLTWSTSAFLYNAGSTDALVRLINVSNGGDTVGGPAEFVLPAGRTASVPGTANWRALVGPLWVIALDAPAEVQAASILRIGAQPDTPNSLPDLFGNARLPVIRDLTPAGEPRAHLATDLGRDRSVRLNVAVYNASNATAVALIEVRSHCDDVLLERDTVIVPPVSIEQFGFIAPTLTCPAWSPGQLGGPERRLYVTVTSDQPGFSFVSVMSQFELPLVTFSIVK